MKNCEELGSEGPSRGAGYGQNCTLTPFSALPADREVHSDPFIRCPPPPAFWLLAVLYQQLSNTTAGKRERCCNYERHSERPHE